MALFSEEDYMATVTATETATGHERSKKSLHNFRLPNLKWGSQRHLRCMKGESDGGGSGDQRLRRRSSPCKFYNRSSRTENGIEEFREKIMSDLRTVADKMTESIFRKQVLGYEKDELESESPKKEKEVSPPEAPGSTVEVKPWNLRKRRAACKAPIPESGNCEGIMSLGNESKKEQRSIFLTTLKKKEIEDDYLMMIGHKPPRRPKKRPRTVQKQINMLYPAFYLPQVVTHDDYKVPDAAETAKR